MPLFGKKEKWSPEKPRMLQYKEYMTPGATTGLAFCSIHGQDSVVVSSLNARGFQATSAEGEKLWSFDTGATVYSLAIANFSGETAILAGSGRKVFAVSDTGKELWQYQMIAPKGLLTGGMKLLQWGPQVQKQYGYNDINHIATGKLNGEDIAIAMGGWDLIAEGPQGISSKGEHIFTLTKKYLLTGQRGLDVIPCMLDFSPRGDSLLVVLQGLSRCVSVISRDAEVIRKFKVKIDMGPRATYTKGGVQDKIRGKLIAGRFDGTEVVVLGDPDARSVSAASLDGKQLWNYETADRMDVNAGINDIAIGVLNKQSIVAVGTFNNTVHIIAANGATLDTWRYPSNVTNVACGKVNGKDAIAVGLYSGQVFIYVTE